MPNLSIDNKDNNFMLLQCTYQEKEQAKSVTDATWDKDRKMWRFPTSSFKLKLLHHAFPDLQVNKNVNEIINANKEIDRRSLEIKSLLDYDLNIVGIKTKLFPYQKVCVKFMLNRDCVANFAELGLGKTLQTLTTIIEHKNNNNISRVLVVCPASLKYNWCNEIEKHTYEKCIVIDGSKKKRIEQYEEFKKNQFILFLIVNYETLRVDIDLLRKYLEFNCIVLDESVKIKNPQAQITKAIKALSNIKYKYILSGYPIANNIEDLWSQIDFIRPGYMGNWWSFEDNYIERGYFKEITGYKNIDILKKKLEPLYIRFLKKDVLKDLPDKIYQNRESKLEDDQLLAYQQMRDELRVYIEKMSEQEVITQTRDILTQLIRLSQITSGFVTDKDMTNPHYFDTNIKLNILEEIIEEVVNANKRSIVIWTRFLPTVKMISDKLSKKYKVAVFTGDTKMKERQNIVDAFQRGEIQVFVGQIQAGGLGINLFHADTEIFYEKSFLSPSAIIQAESRLHRIGQKNTVTIISLIIKDTVDEKFEKMLTKKKYISEQILGDKAMHINKQLVLDFLKDK